jgi:hypothetical protein
MVRLRRFSKALLCVGIIARGVSKLREEKFVDKMSRRSVFSSPRLVFLFLSTVDRTKTCLRPNQKALASRPRSLSYST